jgi:tRNA(adenine34) deaminase
MTYTLLNDPQATAFDRHVMGKVIEESWKAVDHGEMPFTAAVTRGTEIIAMSINKVKRDVNALSHAEMIVLSEAQKKLGTTNLSDCAIYMDVEGCSLCSFGIRETRIPRVVYALTSSMMGGETSSLNILTDENFHFLTRGFYSPPPIIIRNLMASEAQKVWEACYPDEWPNFVRARFGLLEQHQQNGNRQATYREYIHIFSSLLGVPVSELEYVVNRRQVVNRQTSGNINGGILSGVADWLRYFKDQSFAESLKWHFNGLASLKQVLFINLGVSTPFLHIDRRFLNRRDITALYIDKHYGTQIFYNIINKHVPSARSHQDHVLIADLDNPAHQQRICAKAREIVEAENMRTILICIDGLDSFSNLGNVKQLISSLSKILPDTALSVSYKDTSFKQFHFLPHDDLVPRFNLSVYRKRVRYTFSRFRSYPQVPKRIPVYAQFLQAPVV